LSPRPQGIEALARDYGGLRNVDEFEPARVARVAKLSKVCGVNLVTELDGEEFQLRNSFDIAKFADKYTSSERRL